METITQSGKVMFSQTSVILFTGVGGSRHPPLVAPPGQTPPWADTPVGTHTHPWADTPSPEIATAAEVRILLECILVTVFLHSPADSFWF